MTLFHCDAQTSVIQSFHFDYLVFREESKDRAGIKQGKELETGTKKLVLLTDSCLKKIKKRLTVH